MRLEFTALELAASGGLEPARYGFEDSPGGQWRVLREGREHLRLGQGYRLLRAAACGVCATDLARPHLPFPLPQVIGHEVLARGEEGKWHVIEINASHAARGLPAGCPFCDQGLGNHCPERLVLGIHDLPGGFGPFILAPVNNVIEVPEGLPLDSAVLTEPLAAALAAVRVVNSGAGDSVAVLGPRRLGMLVIAGLAAWRREGGASFEIVALIRRESLHRLARDLGADRVLLVDAGFEREPSPLADVVIDTTGTPAGLELALRLAGREVHLKSTHGGEVGGIRHLTEMVVDEISLRPLAPGGGQGQPLAGITEPTWPGGTQPETVAWLAAGDPPAELASRGVEVIRDRSAAAMLARLERDTPPNQVPRAGVVVIDRPSQIDEVVRPVEGREVSLVRPRGAIAVATGGAPDGAKEDVSTLWKELAGRGLKLSTSRCGDFREALALMVRHPELAQVGRKMITHRFSAERLGEAFAAAGSSECVKAVVLHEKGLAAGESSR